MIQNPYQLKGVMITHRLLQDLHEILWLCSPRCAVATCIVFLCGCPTQSIRTPLAKVKSFIPLWKTVFALQGDQEG